MDIYIILTIVILLVCGLFIMLRNDKSKDTSNENFKSEYRESDIILPAPVPQFQYELDPKNDLIISDKDKNNNYPISDYELKIEAPTVPINQKVENDAAFKDVQFIRDKGMEQSMKKKIEINDLEYKRVVEGVTGFDYPQNSYDLLKNIDVKSITKNEYNDNSMHDIYNNAVSKVINNIKQDQIDNITGKKYMVDDESNTANLYKPIYVLKDKYII
jgi:hypothetical protein